MRKAIIRTENQLMYFYNSICQDCPYTGKVTAEYIILHQGGNIEHGTHVPVQVSQSSA